MRLSVLFKRDTPRTHGDARAPSVRSAPERLLAAEAGLAPDLIESVITWLGVAESGNDLVCVRAARLEEAV